MTETGSTDRRRDAWRHLGHLVGAHVTMLRDAAILDDPALAALLTALDGVVRADPPAGLDLAGLAAAFDERVDALTPAGVAGAAGVGRGRADTLATLARLTLRDRLLELAKTVNDARAAVLDLASAHATTLMPAFAGAQAVQPTTFAHHLGGVLGPLGRAAARLPGAFAEVNRSPLGAGALASSPLPVERERVAALLGFDGVIANTFDAVAATDHLVTAVGVAADAAAAPRRFLDDLLVWLRTDPGSVRLADEWVETDPSLPHLRAPGGLARLIERAAGVEVGAAAVASHARRQPYGPVGTATGGLLDGALVAIEGAGAVNNGIRDLLSGGLEVNRAFLANRAGRAHTTSGDLADFLLVEEGLDPVAARNVAALAVGRAMREGIEISGLTPAMLDAAALLTVGRELGVEVETLSRHLAPRRFVERRTATGSPNPDATRAYLDGERLRLGADARWQADTSARLATALDEWERIAAEASS
ncbi:MAG: Argininosuccinate lyase [uncultured Thermomicrobiales bacterium]|uniref:Argininosuccinate lyase n=1 Tax=uncultured Thermomicrobiales bacterium TaxID=1645740 RepID=A0A6J4U742_9BACT|nr:MAG: Argininosuccinate lyase [uncultured Thermomicrobiales bacterium]